ncbi:alpha/beta-hydrolase [Hypoxylon trugodes]|uniref:alpha/beta-hydrolase n=1 Tax=Hypoxylon trugodes TaxID=326681 RepID=UPI002191066A|nr:alpha/beta-hydrolase [Hypoxylon trugodes]KAI1388651.1 alpha/beta-hydrolase [Hypoxylon trugodes]
MTSTKPLIVIISGGWHVPASYDKLSNALRAEGFEVQVPRLPSTGQERPPTADLAVDTSFIRGYFQELVDAGRTVVALMHSYGGHLGTNALYGLGVAARSAKGLQGGVSHLIYMAAHAVVEGEAMMDTIERFGHAHLAPLAMDWDDDGSCVHRDPKTYLVGPGDYSDAEVEEYLGTLVRFNGKNIYDKSEHCAWREGIPIIYIHTTNDMTVAYDYQKYFVEEMKKAGQTVQTFVLETGHCPNFTATQGVVNAVKQVLS